MMLSDGPIKTSNGKDCNLLHWLVCWMDALQCSTVSPNPVFLKNSVACTFSIFLLLSNPEFNYYFVIIYLTTKIAHLQFTLHTFQAHIHCI